MSDDTVDLDVAERAAGADLDGGFARLGALGGVQVVPHVAVLRVEVQPGGDAVEDADVDLAAGGLGACTAPLATSERRTSPLAVLADHCAVRPIDGDPAIGRAHPQLADDLADPGVAVPFLTTALPSMLPACTAPVPVRSSAWSATRSRMMSPPPVLSFTRPAWSTGSRRGRS